MREKRCRQGFAIEEGCRLSIEQNEVCGGYICLKTGSYASRLLKQLKYKNHLNEVLDFGKDGIYVNTSDLLDYEWQVGTKGNRISSLTYGVCTKTLPMSA